MREDEDKMIIMEYIIAEQFDNLEDAALSLSKSLNEPELDRPEIEFKTKLLENKFNELMRLLPSLQTDRGAAFHRHLAFIKNHMSTYGKCNIEDIVKYDIPIIQKTYYEYLKQFPHLDSELRSECETLITNGEYDSALRKAFLVIKERAVHQYNADPTYEYFFY